MSERMKAVREALRLSQREFGERLGVSRDVISNIEYGRVAPRAVLLRHICQCYRVNEHWLSTGEGCMFDGSPDETKRLEEALHIFTTLRPEFQEYVLGQMNSLLKVQEKIQSKD